MVNFERKALNSYLSCSPQTDILINLSRINVLRAAFQNAAVLGMTPEWMCQDDTLSIFSTYGPWDMKKQGSIAPGLRPTTLQREIPHHPWLDIFPFPRMWDNLIRAGDQLDDEEFAKKWGFFLQRCPEILRSTNIWRDRRGERPLARNRIFGLMCES